jgi:hypothetical protein
VEGFGKVLLMAGLLLALVGLILMVGGRIPFLGKLPGDIHIKRENLEFFFPLTTSIVVSLVLTGIVLLVRVFRGK